MLQEQWTVSGFSATRGGQMALNFTALEEAVKLADPAYTTWYKLPLAADVEAIEENGELLFATSPQIFPSIVALMQVGAGLQRVEDRAKKEVGHRLRRALNTSQRTALDINSDVASACYECVVFLLFEAAGMRGEFLSGIKLPDLYFEEDGILVECKDTQVSWKSVDSSSNVEARLRDSILKASDQLANFCDSKSLVRMTFVDLPDEAKRIVEKLPQNDLTLLLSRVHKYSDFPESIVFTDFEIHQRHCFDQSKTLQMNPPRILEPYFPEITSDKSKSIITKLKAASP